MLQNHLLVLAVLYQKHIFLIILPAFKATTLDFNSIPRVKRIEEERKEEKIIPKKEKNNFKIDSNINLRDILIKNSTSRKKVIE